MLKTTRLDNGARILTEVIDGVYSASIGIWIDVGSEDETPENSGVSHALEHMLFKGTKTRTAHEIAQEIEDAGGSLGAATGKENTCYYGQVLGEELPIAIDLLLDMLLNSSLKQEDLDLERQVILEEIKMYEDDPEDLVHETLLAKIWPDHPLSRPITGTPDSVRALTPKILKDHVARYYTPENMIISIAGKFDEQRAIEQLSQGLGKLKPGNAKIKIEPPAITPSIFVYDKDIEQAHMTIASKGCHISDAKRFELAILELSLGGNMSSRLFQEIREKRGLVYNINTFKQSHRYTGLFGVYAGTSPSQLEQVLELTLKEFDKVTSHGLSEQEIKRAKTQLRSDLLLSLESTRSRVSRNAYGELFFGRPITIEELIAQIEKVQAHDIKQLANELLDSKSLSMVIVGPAAKLPKQHTLQLTA